MMIFLPWSILLLIVFAVSGFFVFLHSVFQKKKQELSRLAFQVQLLSDQEKQDVLRLARLEYDLSKAREEKEQFLLLQQKFEHDRSHFFKEILDRSKDLETARNQFETEKKRISEKQEAENKAKMINLQRVWNDHEQQVVAFLRSLVVRAESFFLSFDNTNLPPLWDTSVKPDFLLQYLDTYIVFDAKKSKNIKSYLETQVKMTAEKYSEHAHIAKTVFFVFPEEDVQTLEKRVYMEKGYTFIILSPSALPATLVLLKRMEALQKLANFNPEERESLLSVLVAYDAHIGLQNAMNVIMTERSFELQEQKKQLPEDFQADLSAKIQHHSSASFPVAEAKRLVFRPELQERALKKVEEKLKY